MISSKLRLYIFGCAFVVQAICAPVMAQDDGKFAIIDESIQDLNIVLGAGIGGAVLGLSTLSFVDKPAEHLKNVVVGGALGIITGVAIVSISQASKSRNLYYDNASNENFSTLDRFAWHNQERVKNQTNFASFYTHSFSF